VLNILAVKKNHMESVQSIESGFFRACKLLHAVNLVLMELTKF